MPEYDNYDSPCSPLHLSSIVQDPTIVNFNSSFMPIIVAHHDIIDKSSMEFVIIGFVSDFHVNDKLFYHTPLVNDSYVPDWIDFYPIPDKFARFHVLLNGVLIYNVVYLLNDLLHDNFDFSRAFDRLLRALTMSDLELLRSS